MTRQKINPTEQEEILKMHQQGISINTIAKERRHSPNAISAIINGASDTIPKAEFVNFCSQLLDFKRWDDAIGFVIAKLQELQGGK